MKRAHLLLGAACALMSFSHAAAAPAECVYSLAGKMPLRYTGPNLEITTDGSINGTPATMLVTTGLDQNFLTRTGVERHNLKLRTTGGTMAGLDGKRIPIYETLVQEFIAGSVRASRRSMEVLENFGFTPSYDAMLGAAFLFQTDLEISLATKEMRFFVPKHCENIHLGYWNENVAVIPFEPKDASLNPLFIVHINGHKMSAYISTGSTTSVIGTKAAKRAGINVDGPGVTRHKDAIGLGDGKHTSWTTTGATFQIGSETVRNVTLSIIESSKEDDYVTLGADFLRAYRVLFAMSQKKLYFSPSGGEPFGQQHKLEPWIQAEANSGNADAQLVLATAYKKGKYVPRDDAQAAAWLDKAVAGGSPHALLRSGEEMVQRREYAAAVPPLRAALEQLPAERKAALALYIARLGSGQAERAKQELAATFARTDGDAWPKPIANFYLGTLSAAELLEGASRAGERRCEALTAMVQSHQAQGQEAPAKALEEQVTASCSDQ